MTKTVVVRALGGTTFEVTSLTGVVVRFESGAIGADDQWIETEDLEERARAEGNIPDDTAVSLPF